MLVQAGHRLIALDFGSTKANPNACLLYTSDAADDLLCVDLGGRRSIKKKNTKHKTVPNKKREKPIKDTTINVDHIPTHHNNTNDQYHD